MSSWRILSHSPPFLRPNKLVRSDDGVAPRVDGRWFLLVLFPAALFTLFSAGSGGLVDGRPDVWPEGPFFKSILFIRTRYLFSKQLLDFSKAA